MRQIILILLLSTFAIAQDELPAAVQGIELLRQQMRDPDSFVVERVYASTNHKPGHPNFCIRYRSKNGYKRSSSGAVPCRTVPQLMNLPNG